MSHPEAMRGPVKREERAKVIFDNDFQVFEEVFHGNGDSFSDLLQREELFNCHHHWIPTRCQVWARQLRLSGMGCLMHQGAPSRELNTSLESHGLHKEYLLGLSGRVDQMPLWLFLSNSFTPRGSSVSDKTVPEKHLVAPCWIHSMCSADTSYLAFLKPSVMEGRLGAPGPGVTLSLDSLLWALGESQLLHSKSKGVTQ